MYELYRRVVKTLLVVLGIVLFFGTYIGMAILLFHSGFDGHAAQLPAVAITGGVMVIYCYGAYSWIMWKIAPDTFQQAFRDMRRQGEIR